MSSEVSMVNVSPPRRVARRLGAAVIALLALLVLTGCHEAAGWGRIGLPTDGALPVVPNGKANFAFTYHCDPKRVDGRVYTYYDTSTNYYRGLQIRGKVTHTFVDDGAGGLREARSCQDMVEARVAQFRGKYWSTEKKYCNAPGGSFIILVYDQDNPILPAGEFTGDGFSIELFGGPYNLYTRAGYIEKGNIYAN